MSDTYMPGLDSSKEHWQGGRSRALVGSKELPSSGDLDDSPHNSGHSFQSDGGSQRSEIFVLRTRVAVLQFCFAFT